MQRLTLVALVLVLLAAAQHVNALRCKECDNLDAKGKCKANTVDCPKDRSASCVTVWVDDKLKGAACTDNSYAGTLTNFGIKQQYCQTDE